MTDVSFTPVIYLKEKCPFCMKIRIFLLESGMAGDVVVRDFAPGTNEEQAIRSELAQHLEKISFPTAQLAPGQFLSDSDGIIKQLAEGAKVDAAALPVLTAYLTGPFQQIMTLYRENAELKKQLA